MRLGLPDDADTLLRGEVAVTCDSHARSHDAVTLIVIAFDEERSSICVKAGMRDGEHETTPRFQNSAQGAQQGRDTRHVHKGHIADSGVELAGAERGEVVFASQIQSSIFDLVRAFPRPPSRAVQECWT